MSDQFCPRTDRAIKCIGRHFISGWLRGWAPFDDDLVAVMKYLKSGVGVMLIIMRAWSPYMWNCGPKSCPYLRNLC